MKEFDRIEQLVNEIKAMQEKDEYGLYIHTKNYAEIRAKLEANRI